MMFWCFAILVRCTPFGQDYGPGWLLQHDSFLALTKQRAAPREENDVLQ